MIKVYWHSDFWCKDDRVFLEGIKKMTPGRSGTWKDMVAVDSIDKADFVLAWDTYNFKDLPLERTICFSDIPTCLHDWNQFIDVDKKALLCLKANKFLNPGYWYIDYDYDTLSSLEPSTKSKRASVIFTAKNSLKMFTDRIHFVEKLMRLKAEVDVRGRPRYYFEHNTDLMEHYLGHVGVDQPKYELFEHWVGKELLLDYRYSIEFDNGPTTNYFSERVYDAYLLWCMPLYWGSTDLEKYLPPASFRYINITDESKESARDVIGMINSDIREENLVSIGAARDLLLNKYQMWPYLYDVVTNLDSYIQRSHADGMATK